MRWKFYCKRRTPAAPFASNSQIFGITCLIFLLPLYLHSLISNFSRQTMICCCIQIRQIGLCKLWFAWFMVNSYVSMNQEISLKSEWTRGERRHIQVPRFIHVTPNMWFGILWKSSLNVGTWASIAESPCFT